MLERLATLITPLPADAYSALDRSDVDDGGWGGTATMNAMGSGLLRLLSLPALALLLAFERLAAADRQRREYRADLRAADVAGTAAVVRLLLTVMNTSGLHTVAGSAARRREDPFAALEQVRTRPAPTTSDIAAARARAQAADLRWDDSHPRDDLRIEVVEARPVTPDRATLEARRRLVTSADGELSTLRPGLSRGAGPRPARDLALTDHARTRGQARALGNASDHDRSATPPSAAPVDGGRSQGRVHDRPRHAVGAGLHDHRLLEPGRAPAPLPVAIAKSVSPSKSVWTGRTARAMPSWPTPAIFWHCALVRVASVAMTPIVVARPGMADSPASTEANERACAAARSA